MNTGMPLAYWVDDLSPILFFHIRYYGLAYVLGFVSGWALLRLYHQRGRSPLGVEAVDDLILAVALGVLIGGRLGSYLLYDGWRDFSKDPLGIFKVWQGGMASHGGFLGVAVALLLYSRKKQIAFLQLSDLIVSVAPLGLFFGRIANFINGELWGKVWHGPWAVIFPKSAAPGTPLSLIEPRHPSQLYEAGLEGALLFAYVQWRFWNSKAQRDHHGRITGEFLIAYALVRIFGELFRQPDEGIDLILGLSRGTFYSLFLIASGAVIIRLSLSRRT